MGTRRWSQRPSTEASAPLEKQRERIDAGDGKEENDAQLFFIEPASPKGNGASTASGAPMAASVSHAPNRRQEQRSRVLVAAPGEARGNPKLDFHRARRLAAAGAIGLLALLLPPEKHLNNNSPPPLPLPPSLPPSRNRLLLRLLLTLPSTATSASTLRTPARPPSPSARWSSPRPRPTSRPSSARSA